MNGEYQQYNQGPYDSGFQPGAQGDNINAPLSPKGDAERLDYQSPQYRDKFWAFAFFVHLVVIIIIFATTENPTTVHGPGNGLGTSVPVGKSTGVMVLCGVVAMAFAAAWLSIIKRYSGVIIKISIVLTVIFNAIAALVAFASGSVFLGIVWVLIALLSALYYYFVRHRIPFAQATINLSTSVIQQYPATVFVGFAFVLGQLVWTAFWAATFFKAFSSKGGGNGGAFLLLVSFYWTSEILINIVHVTTAGVTASWFFFSEPKNPTRDSLKRSCTSSFGPICFGSLLIAVVAALRAMVRASRDHDDVCSCILQVFLRCVEDIIEFFNRYAFVRVATYNEDFMTAGKRTWELFKSSGWSAIINDDLSGFVLGLGALIGGVVGGLVGFAASKASDDLEPFSYAFGLVGFILGFFIVWLVLSTLLSAITTIFVLWAEDPSALQNSHPTEYATMADALSSRYGAQFGAADAGGQQQQPYRGSYV